MTDLAARQPNWLERLSPDISATLARFPLAIVLALLGAVAFLGSINGWLPRITEPDQRLLFGLWTAAVLAVAGQLFRESRSEQKLSSLVIAFGLPVAGLALYFVTDTQWMVPYLLPAASLMWLSVASFTRLGRGDERVQAENRFWWMNQRAVTTAALAVLAFVILAVGSIAIERSLTVLFGLDMSDLLYRYILPFAATFLVPVYWLSTIPRLADYDETQIREPDFVSRAIGFLGQFLLVPLVLAYALILLSYAVQIVVTWSLPQGVLGWMVLGFAVTGAATWLVLLPPFMRERLLVRVFRRWWFWLTIIPLALFALALWVRVDAYGLTLERVLLLIGGLWAAGITVLFLIGRGDIRLIPGLAGALLLLFSVGPWNIENLPRWHQMARLNQALLSAGAADSGGLRWTPGLAGTARGALDYLRYEDANPKPEALAELLAEYRIEITPQQVGQIETLLGIPGAPVSAAPVESFRNYVSDPAGDAVSVAATPIYLGRMSAWDGSGGSLVGFDFAMRDGALVLRETSGSDGLTILGSAAVEGQELSSIPLGEWLARQEETRLSDPVIDFSLGGRSYRLVVTDASADAPSPSGPWRVTTLSGLLFSDGAPEVR